MKTLGRVRVSSCVLVVGLCASYAVAATLPTAWGWENGHLENMQAAVLLVGAVAAWMAAWQQRMLPVNAIWKVASLFWLVMVARELGWGATLLPAAGFHPIEGPQYSSSALPWKPAVKWICLALLACCAYWTVRYRLISRVGLRWWREQAMPWGALAVFVLGMLMSAQAEGHGWAGMEFLTAGQRLVMEEMAELWAYIGLWWAQWLLQQHMMAWRDATYLQTLHFAFPQSWQSRSL